MSTLNLVRVGVTTARAAIDAAAAIEPDLGAAQVRLGVLAFLHSHSGSVAAEPGREHLVTAYREWLDTATALFSEGGEGLAREYMRRGAVLGAEIELAGIELAGAEAAAVAEPGSTAR